jgi:hypothetical protein
LRSEAKAAQNATDDYFLSVRSIHSELRDPLECGRARAGSLDGRAVATNHFFTSLKHFRAPDFGLVRADPSSYDSREIQQERQSKQKYAPVKTLSLVYFLVGDIRPKMGKRQFYAKCVA